VEHLEMGVGPHSQDKKKKRSLAGKLLGRSKGDKGGGVPGNLDAGSSSGSLDRLAFGSHQLSRAVEHRWARPGVLGVL